MKNLRISPLRDRKNDGDQNPMDSLANLADLMLVFACGLMLSIVANWNVDLGRGKNLVGLDQGAEIKELDGLDENTGSLESAAGYEEMGIVYKDPQTGKLYMVTK
ncbi:DUF2149 domain-containing protein [Candidatus Formimonas warabiya]|nr:DUF2149 domain-containing protein [Candidatus Formimonas warabiya]